MPQLTNDELIHQTEQNIRQALKDYGKHTDKTRPMDACSDAFIKRLARDSVEAKSKLRNLFSQSPYWNPELNAIVLDTEISYTYNSAKITNIIGKILFHSICLFPEPVVRKQRHASKLIRLFEDLIYFFAYPDIAEKKTKGIDAIHFIAPHAYAPGKKPSRIFLSLCKELGIADNEKGSFFQKQYALLSDELSKSSEKTKLFISLNPAHFITMSNPKSDHRGDTMVSCHSFNKTYYSYVNGCTGYSRDEVTFIVFTASDPNIPETLNNRKTRRQLFMYKPESGILLQSRFYGTSGGIDKQTTTGQNWRKTIQGLLSDLEHKDNTWYTEKHEYENENEIYDFLVDIDDYFAGYCDFFQDSIQTFISFRSTDYKHLEPMMIGKAGLCIHCGNECHEGHTCSKCGELEKYVQCSQCGSWHPESEMIVKNGMHVCKSCFFDGKPALRILYQQRSAIKRNSLDTIFPNDERLKSIFVTLLNIDELFDYLSDQANQNLVLFESIQINPLVRALTHTAYKTMQYIESDPCYNPVSSYNVGVPDHIVYDSLLEYYTNPNPPASAFACTCIHTAPNNERIAV